MKNLFIIPTCMVFLMSCAGTKTGETTRKETINDKSLVQQAEIKQAVEGRRFLIKLTRLYVSQGGRVDLKPTYNYILLDGEKAVISAAYMGRQWGNRPIKGIDMVGRAVTYELRNNAEKNTYEVRMKVKNEWNQFDVTVNISGSGYCDASLTSSKIDYVRYRGNFIPLRPKEDMSNPPATDTDKSSI